jgi:hypothetical protein
MSEYLGDLQLTGWLFQRVLSALYLVAFLVALDQFPALLGEKGLLPAPEFIKNAPFTKAPSIFHLFYSDRFFKTMALCGTGLSLAILTGVPDRLSWWVSCLMWLLSWMLYLSIVNIGQRFYAFGWESMLLEAGFFAAFMGPASMVTPAAPFLILRWMLFRVELGAGFIKLRHDKCWRDLTCLYYHYETQPLPNPLSWYFHRLPKPIHRFGVLFSHFVQVVVPWVLFAPQPFASWAGILIIGHQLLLIVSGNYSWLNWLTVCLGLTAFNDAVLGCLIPSFVPSFLPNNPIAYPPLYDRAMDVLTGVTLVLSIQPTLNLFSRHQLMNFCYNPLHLVNTYGAFGSMSRERYEVVLEGTDEDQLGPETEWAEYEFKAKPGDVRRQPPQVAPYHLRLDWLMWFIPFSVTVAGKRIVNHGFDLWFLRFLQKLLESDGQTIKLLRSNPFPNGPPTFVRARYYLYRYANWQKRRETGTWWERTLLGDYVPPVRLADIEAALARDAI